MTGILFNIKMAYTLIEKSDSYIFSVKIKYIYRSVLVMQIIISYACFLLKDYNNSAIMIYLSWLNTIAIVDYYTGYVYTNMKYMIYIPGAIYLMILFLCDNGYVYIIEMAVTLLICMFLLKLMEHTCGLGSGDVDVLLIGTIFMSFVKIYNTTSDMSMVIHIVYECLLTNTVLFSVAGFLFAIRYILLINFRKMTLKNSKPFVPSIYMASVLYYILLF